jgi:glucose-6-phosphate isomerase
MTIPFRIHTENQYPGGAAPDCYASLVDRAIDQVADEYKTKSKYYMQLPESKDDIPAVKEASEAIRSGFEHLVVIGTGGSSLGARCLLQIAEAGEGPYVHYLENVDGHTLVTTLESLPLEHTAFLFVSKSGGTLETLSQALLIIARLEKEFGTEHVGKTCIAITEPGPRKLRTVAEHYNMRTIDHHPQVGGRFSVMSCTGLLPAAVAGLDIQQLRGGAHEVMQSFVQSPTADHPAVQGGLYQFHHHAEGRPMHVLMPYADQLKLLGDWFRQLTAESLGKQGKGITPIASLGTVDQHSMVQLFLDGADDKCYSFVTFQHPDYGLTISPELAKLADYEYLAGKSLADTMEAAARGTIETFAAREKPLREIRLEQLDEFTLGALLQNFMLETSITGALMEIDAYDQPAVEEGKQRTTRILKAA